MPAGAARASRAGMLFEELNGVSSDCRSYLLASNAEALIVDPLLDRVEAYLARLSTLGLRLAFAADTHTHADHLSGVKELSRRTGARSAGMPRGVVQLPLGEGDVLAVGDLRIRVWASPGHTADSIVLVLPDRVTNKRLLFGREAFLAAMREPRPTKPPLLEEALAYNSTP